MATLRLKQQSCLFDAELQMILLTWILEQKVKSVQMSKMCTTDVYKAVNVSTRKPYSYAKQMHQKYQTLE